MQPNSIVKKWMVLFSALTIGSLLQAATFSSEDNAFTLDMPSGWTRSSSAAASSVLSIQKGSSRIDIKKIDCTTETCIEKKINEDLASVKGKKMKIVGNSYTGEEIKRIEFSTGEPFFYISFFSAKNDFSAGYFLIDSRAYSILAKDLTYAETDLIFSFISPKTPEKPLSLEMDINDPRAYDIAAMPAVEEQPLEISTATAVQPVQTEEKPAQAKTETTKKPSPSFFKKAWKRLQIKTLLSPSMPPYIRQLGHGFDALIVLFALFGLLLAVMLCLRPFLRKEQILPPANPNSLYPIRFARLYGTPSLIFRARDNQGNVLISLSARWDSLFLFTGILLVVLTLIVLAITGFCQNTDLLKISAFAYNTVYSACSLLIPLGFLVFFCGVVWSQLVLREITLYDRKGKKAAIVLQKGFGLKQERYEIYFARSKDVLIMTRKRFALTRQWNLFSKEGEHLAVIEERTLWKALLRKCCGHLWGLLRADYDITGRMDSQGCLENAHAPFDKFICNMDKPQALHARDLLAAGLLINIRDRDKWYPWFN